MEHFSRRRDGTVLASPHNCRTDAQTAKTKKTLISKDCPAYWVVADSSVTRKKSPNIYKKLPKNDFTRKMIDFNTLQNLPKNVGDFGKFIVAKGIKKLPKVQ